MEIFPDFKRKYFFSHQLFGWKFFLILKENYNSLLTSCFLGRALLFLNSVRLGRKSSSVDQNFYKLTKKIIGWPELLSVEFDHNFYWLIKIATSWSNLLSVDQICHQIFFLKIATLDQIWPGLLQRKCVFAQRGQLSY